MLLSRRQYAIAKVCACFFPSLIRKCVAPTGRFRWGQSMKIGLINCKHSTGNPGTSPLHPCCSALTRILGNATSADGVRRINTSSFFMFQRTFSSLHFHRVCKRLSAWSVWLVTPSSMLEEVFGNPNKHGDIIPTRHPGSEMGKNNKSEDLEMLQQTSQNCFHAHWRAKTYLRVIGLTLQRMGKIPCLFKISDTFQFFIARSGKTGTKPSCRSLRLRL